MRYFILSILLSLFTLVFVGCGPEIIPPKLTATINGNTIDVVTGSYQWSSITKKVIADSDIPPNLVKKKNPTIIKPNDPISLQFDYKTKSVEAFIWDNGEQRVGISNNTIVSPNEKGTYVYEIIGNWPEGQVYYAFKIKVE